MLDIVLSNRFKRDLKLAAKRGYKLDLLDQVVDKLSRQEPLPPKNIPEPIPHPCHTLLGEHVSLHHFCF